MLKALGCAALAMVTAWGAAAQPSPEIDWSRARTVTVKLTSFAFSPNRVQLQQGVPVRLVVINEAKGGHDFSAPAFFAHVALKGGTAPAPDGSVALDGGEQAELDLVPGAPGSYPLECTHFMHASFGMKGTIEIVAAKP